MSEIASPKHRSLQLAVSSYSGACWIREMKRTLVGGTLEKLESWETSVVQSFVDAC